MRSVCSACNACSAGAGASRGCGNDSRGKPPTGRPARGPSLALACAAKKGRAPRWAAAHGRFRPGWALPDMGPDMAPDVGPEVRARAMATMAGGRRVCLSEWIRRRNQSAMRSSIRVRPRPDGGAAGRDAVGHAAGAIRRRNCSGAATASQGDRPRSAARRMTVARLAPAACHRRTGCRENGRTVARQRMGMRLAPLKTAPCRPPPGSCGCPRGPA